MQEDGLGDLYTKYQELKKRLEDEGLFLDEHKKLIPKFPKTIGVLTSQTGSVIKDIINVSTRRNPNCNIKIYPVPVQGKGAEIKIAEGIKYFNENILVDVIIIARGGGSLEDLWPFNEELLAREIFMSNIPLISAVGHETDFTISDFVADLRAPTPSAAAELAVPNILDIKQNLIEINNRLKMLLSRKIQLMKLKYEKCMSSNIFKEPTRKIEERAIKLDEMVRVLENKIIEKQKNEKLKYIELISKLDTLSPLKTLTRGYVIAEKENKIIKSIKDVKKDDNITLKLVDGNISAKIN